MTDFYKLTLVDLNLGIDDLLDNRSELLQTTETGRIYAKILAKRRSEFESIPGAVDGKPFAEELGDTDSEHDGIGRSVFMMTEAYINNPLISKDLAATAMKIRSAFIPELSELTSRYTDEASAASDREDLLEELKSDLDRFPIAEPENSTLGTWVEEFLSRGEKIGDLLAKRADILSTNRRVLLKLRGSTIRMLNRFRAALDDELTSDPELPRDIDLKIFGYFDELESMRGSKKRNQDPKS